MLYMGYSEKISVVMSVYKNDHAPFFKDSIESLLVQTYPPDEIVIVIDGIVDHSIEEVINQYCKNRQFKIIRLLKNNGLANALNVGITNAKNQLIARMDSDDISFPNRLEKQINYLKMNDLDIVGGQIIEFGSSISQIISERKVPLYHEDILKFIKYRSPFNHPTVLFKKDVFDTLNGYDVKIFPEDYDFFVRAYLHGFKMGNIRDNILWFRIGENSSSAIKRRWGKAYAKKEFKLYQKFYKIGFFNRIEFFKVVIFKITLRYLPFPIFKFIYLKIAR